MKSFAIKNRPLMVRRNRVKTEKKEQIPVEYKETPEEFKNDVEEKEAFLYTSKINAARNFSKYL